MGFILYDRNEYYDILRGANQDSLQSGQYKSALNNNQQITRDIETYAERFPELPADVSAGLAIAGVPTDGS